LQMSSSPVRRCGPRGQSRYTNLFPAQSIGHPNPVERLFEQGEISNLVYKILFIS
jgi:hypothetical protein